MSVSPGVVAEATCGAAGGALLENQTVPATSSTSAAAAATGTHAPNMLGPLPNTRCHHGVRASASIDAAIFAHKRGGGIMSSSSPAVRRMLEKSATTAWHRAQ